MTFTIYGEQFAVDMHRAKPAVRSELTVGFDTGDSGPGSFNITVKDASLFEADTPVTIGNETFEVSGTPSGTTIPVAFAGVFHPFAGDGATNQFPGAHSTAPNANVGNWQVNAPTWVSSTPSTWIGKKVALHVHRIKGGVWDTKAQSKVWFAGIIEDVGTVGPLGTSIQCSGIEELIANALVLRDQWSAKPKEGHIFKDGDYVRVRFHKMSGTTSGNISAYLTAATPGTGTSEFPSGRYTVQEFCSVLGDLLDADATIGVAGSSFTLRWSAYVFSSPAGPRFELVATEGDAVQGIIDIVASDRTILTWLGFDSAYGPDYTDAGTVTGTLSDFSQRVRIVSEQAPYRYTTFAIGGNGLDGTGVIDIEDVDGTFVDHTSLLPPAAQELVGSGEAWSFYSFGDKVIFLGKRINDTQIAGITINLPLSQMTIDPAEAEAALRLDGGKGIRIKQIFFACDTFTNIIAKLFASTDGNGTNHADYDVFPFGAGIPWSLLGSAFIESLKAVEQSSTEDSLSIIVEKPTRLWDIINSDFALRMAAPVWKDGGIRIAQFTVPNASTPDHVLDETNKSDTRDTVTSTVRDYLAHTVKIKYNRNPLTDKYLDEFICRDASAYQSSGGAGATKTIKARNSYSGVAASGASVEALGDMLTAKFLPVLSRPLRRFNRSISHNLFHMAPGDTVTMSDDRVRDPNTGTLGLTARAGTVISISHSLGISSGGQTYHGEADILFTEEDRLFPLAPSAEHATVTSGAYTDGWDSSGKSLLVEKHSFSRTTAQTDAQSFASGMAVRITELDPADPAAADSFADVIDGEPTLEAVTGYDEITLTDGFGVGGRPAFDSSKTYLVDFGEYDDCTAAQILKSFQADDVDGQILDLIEPNLVADAPKQGTSVAADLTLLPARHAAEQFGDGVPVSASLFRNLCRLGNNLTNYKTAPQTPYVTQTEAIQLTGSADIFFVIWSFAFYLGNERWPASMQRKLNIAPLFRSDGLVTSTIRVTSSQNPAKGTSYVDTSWFGPKKQASYTASTSTMGVATAQELEVVRDQDKPYITWITVEGNDKAGFKGLAELHLGPLQ
jgi:hypothetical protein